MAKATAVVGRGRIYRGKRRGRAAIMEFAKQMFTSARVG
jgi:hypothetical protein